MNQPILPYAGTSGHSGSEASRDRAHDRDQSGKTASIQQSILAYITARGAPGATVADVRAAFRDDHHGTLSGALTALHKAGRLLRLTEKRNRCSIYVAPQFLLGRDAVAPRVNKGSAVRAEFDYVYGFRTCKVYIQGVLVFDGVERSALSSLATESSDDPAHRPT